MKKTPELVSPDDGQALSSELKRGFTLRSAITVGFAFISPIVALYGVFSIVVSAAGAPGWWAFVIVLAGQLLVALSFGELASKWPLAGGVYQWAKGLVGPKFGWFCGWVYAWTLLIATGSAMFIAAGFLPVVFGWAEFSPTSHVAVAVAMIIVVTALNCLGQSPLKIMTSAASLIAVVGCIGIGGVLLGLFRVEPIDVVLGPFVHGEGSSAMGIAGMTAAIAYVGWAFVGFESAGTIAEEVQDPQRAVPKAMFISLISVGGVVLFAGLAIILAAPDLSVFNDPDIPDPLVYILTFHLGEAVVRPLFAMVTIAFLATAMAAQATGARVLWSFARDDTLPGSAWMRTLTTKSRVPVRALLVTAFIPTVIVLLSLQGAVYTTMILFAIVGFYIAFAFPLLGLLYRKIQGSWEPASFSLGRLSTTITAIAALWVLFELVNIAWPRDDTAPWYIQWAVPILVAVVGGTGALVAFFKRREITEATLSD